LIALFLLGWGGWYLWSNRNPPLTSKPEVLAAFMATPKYGNQSPETQQKYRDAWQKIPRDQRDAAEAKLTDDQKDLYDQNRFQAMSTDPRAQDWQKRQAEMQQALLDAHSPQDKRALFEKQRADMESRRAQWQANATSQPTTQASGGPGGGQGRGGGGPGGAGGGQGRGGGGPGGREGARESAPPMAREMGAERRVIGRELQKERSNSGG
jgi:hypothetical protein